MKGSDKIVFLQQTLMTRCNIARLICGFVLFLRCGNTFRLLFSVFTIVDGELETTRYCTLLQSENVQLFKTFPEGSQQFTFFPARSKMCCFADTTDIQVFCSLSLVGCLFVCLDCLLISVFLEVASSFGRLRRGPVSYYVQRCSVLCWFSISFILMTWLFFFGRTNVALKKNQLDRRTDRRFGQ